MTDASLPPAPDDSPRLDAFPADFLWGAATAAYQIEGAVDSDGRRPSIWDSFAHSPRATLNGDTGDIACDHYHRWRDDFDLVKSLNLNAYRFSVSWARLQPTGRGPLNALGVAHYRAQLERLLALGIRPFVTLYHWDLPQELEDAGGWPVRETIDRFAEYASLTAEALGDLAADWITTNESWCQAFLGYGEGKHAPGRRDWRAAVAAAHHLNLAHGLAVRAIRAARPGASVGTAQLVVDFVPASSAPADIAASRRWDAHHNQTFLGPLGGGGYPADVLDLYSADGLADLLRPGDDAVMAEPIDFLGVNHYQQVVVAHDQNAAVPLRARDTPAEPALTSLGWSVKPESLRNVLVRVAGEFPDLPLYVTESGASFDDYVDPHGQVIDHERVDYLRRYLAAAGDAIKEGVDLRGYFAWSLLDNFEWAEGYRKRFGLIYVDYATQARILKASSVWYRDLISDHAALSRPA
ncbi:GH1 family beta-glucosidase [Jiangella aurantiaca]|uniref:GH1 family beta-glucosidase n=1 Tax=Jiangella aurantiaca TaxID=2530373 RepID=UPI001EF120A4|nr:GH1 family beta-glucosidase [Jiangella aurantiaca]